MRLATALFCFACSSVAGASLGFSVEPPRPQSPSSQQGPIGGLASAENPDNAVDEDRDGWLGTSHGFQVRAADPRVLVTPERLQVALQRMAGPAACEPYKGWFQKLKAAADARKDVDMGGLALLYQVTGNKAYRCPIADRSRAWCSTCRRARRPTWMRPPGQCASRRPGPKEKRYRCPRWASPESA